MKFWRPTRAAPPIAAGQAVAPAKVVAMNPEPDSRPFITIANQYVGTFQIYVEPWGNDHTIASGDFIRLHSVDVSTGQLQLHYVPEGIVVWFTGDDEPRLFNTAGQELSL